ncbi:MAG: efflux RND transporter periplasmic adaptor subunit [Anaerolineales bacterium]|nr:efflux RND transporter periplasmic adaptor subunit [Anaerolineales bacterium]
MRVVPRWVVVVGILVILGIVVYGLGRIVVPVRRGADMQTAESSFVASSDADRRGGRGPFGFVRRMFGGGSDDMADVETAEVVLLDAAEKIDASGSVIAFQSGEVYWETTGTVANVMVQVGDHVNVGDVLLDLDPLTVPQNVIMAQSDLISARQSLDDLLNPTVLQITEAQQDVVEAEDILDELRTPSALAIANAQMTVAVAQEDLDQLQDPAALDLANTQQAVAVAQEDLDRLQDPTALDLANARQAVADANEALMDINAPSAAQIAAAEQEVAGAQDVLRDQQEALDELLDPDIDVLEDAIRDAEFELARVEQDVELADIGSATSSLENAKDALETAQDRRASVQEALDGCKVVKVEQDDEKDYMQITVSEDVLHGGFSYLEGSVYEVFEETGQTMIDTYGNVVTKKTYRVCDPDRAVTVDGVTRTLAEADEDVVAAGDRVREAELNLESTRMSNTTALDVANEKLQDARESLDDALSGPDSVDLAVAEASVQDAIGSLADAKEQLDQLLDPQPEDIAVAEARLAEGQEHLQELLNGPDQDDIAAAEARVTAAEATLSSLQVVAPFDGHVLAVNYLPGDTTEQSKSAARLANMSQLRVEVSVDETEVNGVKVGQSVKLTFDAIPETEVAGDVTEVAPYGETVQGLVRYPVTVTLRDTKSEILLGMTANVQIVQEVLRDALAVPIDAIQYDDEGEYVMLFNGLGKEQTRVAVKSGVIQGAQVVVIGDLLPRQKVVIFTPKPTESGSPFGGRD